ncbi:MAG: YXWGXW repeat-containing protein [Gemmatimonadota bacterium]|nr:YXWGXW repeat-containing protein [Gemmatimonadota bacterium]
MLRSVKIGLMSIGLATAPLIGCASAPAQGGRVYAREGPPVERTEVVIERPGPAYVWLRGHWGYSGGGYAWVPGRWERPDRPNRRWAEGRWARDRHGYFWVEGHWR